VGSISTANGPCSSVYQSSRDLCRRCRTRRGAGRDRKMTIRLVLALVVSTLDYCNSALVDLPLLTKFAPVQNAATRLVSELHVRDLVTCLLTAIHWLSVRWRVLFTLCCIMHSVLHETCPVYLTNTVELVSASRPRFGLPSASSTSTSTNYTAAVAPSLANVLAHTPIPH